MRILCWFGFHKWKYDIYRDVVGEVTSFYRDCSSCGLHEELAP